MSVEPTCTETSIEPSSDWEELNTKDRDKIWTVAKLGFERLQENLHLCKHKKKEVEQIKDANTKGNVFSIITGLALVGIGAVIGLACAPAGVVISATGVSLITGAVADEINKSCEEKDPNEKKQQNSHPNEIQNGGDISIDISI